MIRFLKKSYSFIYSWLSKFILGYKLSLFSDIIILTVSSYVLLKKAISISITGWLLNNVLHQSSVNFFVFLAISTIIFAVAIKALSLIFINFPAVKHANIEPQHISACLQTMNNEIVSHINKCNEVNESPNIRKLTDQHAFDVNTRMITEALAEHIRKSFESMKIKRKDLFISLYSYDEKKGVLLYELHYDPRRDLVNTKNITLTEEKCSTYECVKCMKSSDNTCYIVEKSHYTKGANPKRYKTFQQYLGCKLETNGYVFGFLNIELHNHRIFNGEDEMQDFMEENVFPFKLMFEYQYLKRDFFSKFQELEKNWEGVNS